MNYILNGVKIIIIVQKKGNFELDLFLDIEEFEERVGNEEH